MRNLTNFAVAKLLVIFLFSLLTVATARKRDFQVAEFNTLNATIGGRLRSATPLALPCFSNYDGKSVTPDPQACSVAQANYDTWTYRSLRYGNTMASTWEACFTSDESCLLDYTDPSNPLAYNGTECSQGSISEYYIEVQEASDVTAAFNFSKATGIPLSIKNSGHDFFGRSVKKGSLALWMRNLSSLTYHEAFTPCGCSGESSYQAITTGTGTPALNVYQFADQHNVTVVGGFGSSVAWHGGWVLGGGHSLLSPVYGMGVDRVLEFKVVTPDGELRVANQCQNTDLFWALRGGGGGTFGVVLEATSRVEKQLTLQFANFTIGYTNEAAQKFFEVIVNNTMKWSSQGWGGLIGPAVGHYLLNPVLTLSEANDSLKELSEFVIANGGNFTLQTVPSWMSFFNAHPGLDLTGIPSATGSRLIPNEVFECETGRSELTNLMVTSPSLNVLLTTPSVFNASANETSITPAWRRSAWHLAGLIGWDYNSTTTEIKQTFETLHNLTEAMRVIAPNSGSYFNEGDVYETDYQEAFWGQNYPALLKIKQKYDPCGLLDCWRCVGWKGPSSKNYDCYLDIPL